MKTVICVFERNYEDDNWKGELIQIFQNPNDALDYIQKSKNVDLFWEQWQITDETRGNVE